MSCGLLPDHPELVFRINDNGCGPDLLRQVFLERGWVEFDEDTQQDHDWNMWWRTSRFRTSDYDVVYPWQRLNHYPRSSLITKKDGLARNLKRMQCVHGASVFNFSPLSFNLPNDYTKYVKIYEAMRQKASQRAPLWICKPADLSRGRGIFIFRDLSDLLYDCNAVVQLYIDNPLLIGGYKSDLRIYVAVTSFQPLRVYVHEEGIVRFSTEKFDLSSTKNVFAHLTNTSINKHSPAYTEDKEQVGPGCKWTLSQLRRYFLSSNINDQMLWRRIINIVVLTLLIQAPQVQKVDGCFELYGFDVLVDENLKPWLLEVNFSPSLGVDCQADVLAKKPMLHDLMDLLTYTAHDAARGAPTSQNPAQQESSFEKRRRSLPPQSQRNPPVGRRNERIRTQGRKQNRIHSGRTDISSLGGSRENLPGSLTMPGVKGPWQDEAMVGDREGRGSRGGAAEDTETAGVNSEDPSGVPPAPSLEKNSKASVSADSHHSKGSQDSKDSGIGSAGRSGRTGGGAAAVQGGVFGCLRDPSPGPPHTQGLRLGSGLRRGGSSMSGGEGELGLTLPSLESSAHSRHSTVWSPHRAAYFSDSEQPHDSHPQQLSGPHFAGRQAAKKGGGRLGRGAGAREGGGGRWQPHGQTLPHRQTLPLTQRSTASTVSGQSHFTSGSRHTATRLRQTPHHPHNLPPTSKHTPGYPRNKPHQHGNAVSNNDASSFSQLKKQVGNFFLVYPFNEVTHRTATSLDAKVIIRETQNLIREALNTTVSSSRTGMDSEGADSRTNEGLWAPLRTVGDDI